MNEYTPIIGLETHVELATQSKMFCSCSALYFGQKPNSHTCPVCLGLPGALPVPNKKAIEWCILIALALNCEINKFSKFDRKNYFYPDLAKGYQISQYDLPFGFEGKIRLSNNKIIGIRRVHMEEDTGKLQHLENSSLIDFNRSGVPLVEIVTEPDFRTPEEVTEYLQKLQRIVRYLDVSNADMEKGEMRLEPNISLKNIRQVASDKLPPYKVEVKNINSFKFVDKAIKYEIYRQTEILERGELPTQETRGWNESKQKTISQRSKEEAQDYRYFPEPDIPPIIYTTEMISSLKKQLPELQDEKIVRFCDLYELPANDSEILTRDKRLADYFEESVKIAANQDISAKKIANTIINHKVDIDNILPSELIKSITTQSKIAHIDDGELKIIIIGILTENPKAVEDYKNGKENVIMFLLGQTMKKINKKVDVNIVKDKLIQTINK